MTKERAVAETIKKHTGCSLVQINRVAFGMVELGLARTRLEALANILKELEQI